MNNSKHIIFNNASGQRAVWHTLGCIPARTFAHIVFFVVMSTSQAFANINYIDTSKISNDSEFITALIFVQDNSQYYDHWSPEWNYDKPKQDLTNRLREYYKYFSTLPKNNAEIYLLIGDIAHYLYNLNDEEYHEIAIKNYEEAIQINNKDYRAYWFLAYHYALSNLPAQAIDHFKKAEQLLPPKPPADFWNDYASAAYFANMPSHCMYAMDKVKSISGKEGSFQQKFGEVIAKRIVPVDKKQFYENKDIWATTQGDKITFTSRPLGIKILLDSAWHLKISDYQNHQAAFIVEPPTIADRQGKKIGYSIAIIMKTADDNDNLDTVINTYLAKYQNKKKVTFSDKYDKMIAYEIIDKTMYTNIGGGHLYMIGIERNEPNYPGLLLETSMSLPYGNQGEATYYRATNVKNRFKGKIFYLIMLDSCENIHKQSFSIFKSFFDNQVVIE